MSCVKLPSAVLLLVLSGLYLISLGCGSLPPGNLPLSAPPSGSAGAVSVSISPQKAALGAGDSLQFTATSSGPPTADLEWLADGVPGGNSASGTISRSGLYIAPQQVTANATIVVAVSSKTPPTKVSSATVTVLPGLAPITISLAPGVASLYPSQAQQFTASVKGTTNQGISWFVNGNEGGNSSIGTISSTGTYTAPLSAPAVPSVTITAMSKYDTASSATAAVTIMVAPAGPISGTGTPPAAYYVDNCVTVGSDSNNGTSTSTPWLTVAHVNAQSFNPGDSVLFQKTCTWRETLTVPTSGSSGNPITFGSYGSGALPVFDGANVFSSWATESSIYYASASANPYQVFRDNVRLTLAASKGALATGDWWWDPTNLRIYVFDNPSGHTMEASVRNNGININAQSYITLNGLDVEKALQQGIYNSGVASYLTIKGVASNYSALDGMVLATAADLSTPLLGAVIENSTFSYNGEHGFISEGYTPGLLVQSNVSHHNCLAVKSGYSSWCAGLRMLSNDPPPVRATNVIFQYNLVYSNGVDASNRGVGIHFDTTGAGSQIRYNLVYGNSMIGIELENTSDTSDTSAMSQAIIGNLVYNQTSVPHTSGIYLYRGSKYNVIANNTVYGNGYNIQISGLYGGSDPVGMIGNIISNNISESWITNSLLAQYGGENDGSNGSGNVYTYNAFGTAASDFIQWGSGVYHSTYSTWETAKGGCGTTGCSHSIQTAPTFTNASVGNFTLVSGSSAIDAGTNLGSTYQMSLDPRTSFPWGTLNQDSLGSGWEIGAFVFVQQISPAPPTSPSPTVK